MTMIALSDEKRGYSLAQVASADIPPAAIAWVGGELFPRLAAYWPNSAGHFNKAIVTSVEIWCRGILGFAANQVVMAVDTMALDPARQFAPRPAEVRAQLLEMFPAPVAEQPPRVDKRTISIRAIEMQAEATIYAAHRARLGCHEKASAAVTAEDVDAEHCRLVAYYRGQGIEITNQFKSILGD